MLHCSLQIYHNVSDDPKQNLSVFIRVTTIKYPNEYLQTFIKLLPQRMIKLKLNIGCSCTLLGMDQQYNAIANTEHSLRKTYIKMLQKTRNKVTNWLNPNSTEKSHQLKILKQFHWLSFSILYSTISHEKNKSRSNEIIHNTLYINTACNVTSIYYISEYKSYI